MGATLGPMDRKAELVRRGVTYREIAAACQTTPGTVCRVIGGERLDQPAGSRVATYIAGVLRLPMATVFPELAGDRDGGPRARAGIQGTTDRADET